MTKQHYKAIIVDDEYSARHNLRVALGKFLPELEIVAACGNGREGLASIAREQPDLVISDVRMPEMDGLELAEAVAHEGFDTVVVLCSGYADFDAVRRAMDAGVFSYTLKSEGYGVLAEKIRSALAFLADRREKREAVRLRDSCFDGVKISLMNRLLSGEDVVDELRNAGVAFPESGTVVYASFVGTARGGGALKQSVRR